jgi:ACS family allantoate permease-like MFS transporter
MSNEKHLESIDYRSTSGISNIATASSLRDADEALAFLQNHSQATAITEAGNAILEDPVQLKKLQQKIDRTIVPLLAAIYFLQFLDKTTLAYTAVMGIRKDAHLKGQDYSNLSMLFYIGARPPTHSNFQLSLPSHYPRSALEILPLTIP